MKHATWMTVLAAGLCLCLALASAPAALAGDMAKPEIKLDIFEVPQYDGYWYYAKGVEPTKGEPGDRGAPLPMSFLFSIKNPNPYPVQMSSMKFTVAFDGFSLVTVNNQDSIWIPANMSTNVRVTTMITVRSALLNLMVTSGFALKEKGWTPWDALQRWWEGVPDYSVPVDLKEGAAVFSNQGGQTDVVSFSASFP